MPMGMADVATVLFDRFLKFDAGRAGLARPRPLRALGRPRLDAALRAAAPDRLPGMTLERARGASASSARDTPGHPEYGHTPGVETTTGPAGPGPRHRRRHGHGRAASGARFGDDLVDHRTWVIAGDGCLMEGVSHEAISLAGRLKLDRLTVLWDDNGITIDGADLARRPRPTSWPASRPPAGR